MADSIVKVGDDSIKITTPSTKEEVITITTLLEQKRLLQLKLSRFEAQVLLDRTRISGQLADVNALIQKARELGIVIPS